MGMSILPNTYGRLGIFFDTPSFKREEDGSVIQNPIIGVSGFYSQVRKYDSHADVCMLIIGFKPTGLQRLFDFPVDELSDKNVSLADIFPNDYVELLERLYSARSWDRRIEIIESFLSKKLEPENTYGELDKMVEYLFHTGGTKRVKEIAAQFYLTEKTLRRRFVNGIGISPKMFTKLIRFQKGLRLMSEDQDLNLGEIAHELEYFDQAHFIHEFTAFYGRSPKHFILAKRSVLGKYYDENTGKSRHANLAYL